MNTTLIIRRAASVLGLVGLASFASMSHADPLSLVGHCSVSSITPGQGKCLLSATLSDNIGSPANVRKAQVKVNGILVAQSVNDGANPLPYFSSMISGTIAVACGASYTVTAHIARQGSSTYDQVGYLPPVVCPAAQ